MDKNIVRHSKTGASATVLMWLTPAVLIVPNVLLSLGEPGYTIWDRLANVALPLGAYMLWTALWRRTGIGVLLLLPFMVLAAFEYVIHCLYGESIIAIDMFLNVATTNSTEVTELLGNLLWAIAAVLLLYLPPIVLAVVSVFKGKGARTGSRRAAMIAGGILTALGMVFLACSFAYDRTAYAPDRKLFPVNVISNMIEAVHRSAANGTHEQAAAGFTFHATDSRAADESEIYVLVIGETSRAGNWQLNGYERATNPKLGSLPQGNIVSFSHVLSESNTTHKSVPLLMSHLSAREFGDSINSSRSIITLFKEAGYRTAWFSNQQRNHALIDDFGSEADTAVFLTDNGLHGHDMALCAPLQSFLAQGDSKKFVVLHSYGSHFNYRDRYDDSVRHFLPDDATDANASNRAELLNAYDNSIRYVDALLDSVIEIVGQSGRPAAMLYVADHGEDIFDDERGRFLHASPTPTYWQLHVPMLLWLSDEYIARYPEQARAVRRNKDRLISSSSSVFPTMASLAGVASPVLSPQSSLAADAYTEPSPVFLNDYNEAVPLRQSGLRNNDLEILARNFDF